MMIYTYLLDIIKYAIAGVGVVWFAYYLFKPYLDRSDSRQLIELKKTIENQTLPLRLQAYERVVLFIERINPSNLLIRLNSTEYTAQQLHSVVVAEIRNEYQHNVTQQIYISSRAWVVVKQVKEDTLSVVTNAVKGLPGDASGLDLCRTVLTHLTHLQDNPYDIAVNMIRTDIENLF